MGNRGIASANGLYVEFQAAVLKALPRDIPDDIALGWACNGKVLSEVLAKALLPSVIGLTTIQKLAREIMGKNFFGVEEAVQHFGVTPTRAQLSALAEIPFTEAELRECKDTHVLVAVFQMSILDVRGKDEQKLFYSQEDAWYNEQVFAKQKGNRTFWQLVRKTPVDNSTSKTWDEQQTLLVKNEETPTARVMVYTIIGHFLATGERLFENIYVRCSDVVSNGYRVVVGNFDAGGLNVSSYWDDHRHSRIGVASAQKFD